MDWVLCVWLVFFANNFGKFFGRHNCDIKGSHRCFIHRRFLDIRIRIFYRIIELGEVLGYLFCGNFGTSGHHTAQKNFCIICHSSQLKATIACILDNGDIGCIKRENIAGLCCKNFCIFCQVAQIQAFHWVFRSFPFCLYIQRFIFFRTGDADSLHDFQALFQRGFRLFKLNGLFFKSHEADASLFVLFLSKSLQDCSKGITREGIACESDFIIIYIIFDLFRAILGKVDDTHAVQPVIQVVQFNRDLYFIFRFNDFSVVDK